MGQNYLHKGQFLLNSTCLFCNLGYYLERAGDICGQYQPTENYVWSYHIFWILLKIHAKWYIILIFSAMFKSFHEIC